MDAMGTRAERLVYNLRANSGSVCPVAFQEILTSILSKKYIYALGRLRAIIIHRSSTCW
jgi:hypothetical protein